MTKPENLEFLINLDKQVHYITQGWSIIGGVITPGSGGTRKFFYDVDNFRRERKIREDEIKQVVEIVNREENVFMYPDKIWISGLGYRVVHVLQPYPGVQPEKQQLLAFIEPQLPDRWDFNKLAGEVLRTEKNIRGLRFYGLPEVKHREAYPL